ncbi:MAG: AbrB family transcriptional regulator [Cyanobacteria bacterium J06639_1]
MADIPSPPLTGKALLQKMESLNHLSRRERARQCGYVTTSKSNKARVNLTGFYDAILAAKGVELSPGISRDGRGREPTYRVTVHKNGQLIIGSAYTKKMNLNPGDEFEIQLGYKHIHLKQIANGSAE